MARRPTKPTVQPEYDGYRDIPLREESNWRKTLLFLRSERFRFIVASLIALFVLYALVSFISFFVAGANDYSILQLPSPERKAMRAQITNTMGLPGALMTDFFVDDAFGVAYICIVLFMGLLSLRLFGVIRQTVWKPFFATIFTVLYGAILLAFVQAVIGFHTFFRLGGQFGEWVANLGISYIHPLGMIFVLIAVLLIFFVCIDRNTIPNLKRFGCWVAGLFSRKEKAAEPMVNTVENQPAEEQEDPVIEEVETAAAPETVIDLGHLVDSTPTAEPEVTRVPELIIEQPETPVDMPEEPEAEAQDEEVEDTDEDTISLEMEKTTEVEMAENDPEYILKTQGPFDPRAELAQYQFPSISLLKTYDNENTPIINQEEQNENATRIVTTLRNYGVEIKSIKATVGPTVTLYEVVPKEGVKISKIQSLEQDIMLSLSAIGIRIIAPMPGKGTVGIEVPNENPQTVSMHSVIASKAFQENKKMRLPIAMGRTITNDIFMFDLAKTPHLLVAGATGQGKSVAINAIITSLLYKKHPAELKMVLVDPKMVEFMPYKPLLRHYLAAMPDTTEDEVIITDCMKVINTLNSLVIEMENRYKLLMDAGVRNLEDYNEKFINRRLNPTKVVAENLHHQYLPYIVIVIDEYGDFIMQAGKQVETPIARITQKARAVGMHMILATQRPSVNIVTGVIKANIPTRIALRTQSVIDSRTVLDAKGADQLIGKGDMLYSGNGTITRIQCAFVDTPEVDAIVEHIEKQQHYFEPYQLPEYVPEGQEGEALAPGSVDMKRLDPMFADVARYVVAKQEGSTSRLQRAFEIGYNRAGKLSDQLEAAGIVGPNKGPKGRDVLIQDMDALDQLLQTLNA